MRSLLVTGIQHAHPPCQHTASSNYPGDGRAALPFAGDAPPPSSTRSKKRQPQRANPTRRRHRQPAATLGSHRRGPEALARSLSRSFATGLTQPCQVRPLQPPGTSVPKLAAGPRCARVTSTATRASEAAAASGRRAHVVAGRRTWGLRPGAASGRHRPARAGGGARCEPGRPKTRGAEGAPGAPSGSLCSSRGRPQAGRHKFEWGSNLQGKIIIKFIGGGGFSRDKCKGLPSRSEFFQGGHNPLLATLGMPARGGGRVEASPGGNAIPSHPVAAGTLPARFSAAGEPRPGTKRRCGQPAECGYFEARGSQAVCLPDSFRFCWGRNSRTRAAQN